MSKREASKEVHIQSPIRSVKFHVTDSGVVATVKVMGPAASGKVRLHAKSTAELAIKISQALVRVGIALG